MIIIYIVQGNHIHGAGIERSASQLEPMVRPSVPLPGYFLSLLHLSAQEQQQQQQQQEEQLQHRQQPQDHHWQQQHQQQQLQEHHRQQQQEYRQKRRILQHNRLVAEGLQKAQESSNTWDNQSTNTWAVPHDLYQASSQVRAAHTQNFRPSEAVIASRANKIQPHSTFIAILAMQYLLEALNGETHLMASVYGRARFTRMWILDLRFEHLTASHRFYEVQLHKVNGFVLN